MVIKIILKIEVNSRQLSSYEKGNSNSVWSVYTDQLSYIEQTHDVLNVNFLWNYCVCVINLPKYDKSEVDWLYSTVNKISKDFDNFNTNKLCALYRVPGYSFNDCPQLKYLKLQEAHIHLWLSLNQFLKDAYTIGTNSIQ